MRLIDIQMLKHLTPMDGADTYLCSISKYNKDRYIWSVEGQVKAWVESRGGTMRRLEDRPRTVGDRKGFVVQIRFPAYSPMKEIMATLYK